jgi:hypothetical protein
MRENLLNLIDSKIEEIVRTMIMTMIIRLVMHYATSRGELMKVMPELKLGERQLERTFIQAQMNTPIVPESLVPDALDITPVIVRL